MLTVPRLCTSQPQDGFFFCFSNGYNLQSGWMLHALPRKKNYKHLSSQGEKRPPQMLVRGHHKGDSYHPLRRQDQVKAQALEESLQVKGHRTRTSIHKDPSLKMSAHALCPKHSTAWSTQQAADLTAGINTCTGPVHSHPCSHRGGIQWSKVF